MGETLRVVLASAPDGFAEDETDGPEVDGVALDEDGRASDAVPLGTGLSRLVEIAGETAMDRVSNGSAGVDVLGAASGWGLRVAR